MNQTLNGLTKPSRKFERIHAVSIKPLQTVIGDNEDDDQIFACFVDAKSTEHRLPCSIAAARRIEGGKQRSGKSNWALDGKLDRDFYIHISNINGVRTVVGVDQLPKIELRRMVSKGDENADSDDLVMTVNPSTGDMDVSEIPSNSSVQSLLRILQKVDTLEFIEPGQEIPPGLVVSEVHGNKVTLSPQ